MRRDTLLRLAPEVRLTIAGDHLVAEGADDAVVCDASLLGLLDTFRQPRTLEQALAALPPSAKHEWMAASAQLVDLVGAGVLRCDGAATAPRAPDHGFGSMEPHIGMLADERRTRLYVEAIRRVVRPGDVVLDLGTGTGVLAIAAAQAGARRVYAVERTSIADVAARMFERNGVADRITLLRDTSTRVELPERAQVLTSEIIGTEPLSERLLEYTRDAAERLLVPGARVLPRRMRVLARAVSMADGVIERLAVGPETAARWQRAYGIDFTALSDLPIDRAPWFTIRAADAGSFTPLTPAIELLDIDLADPPRPPVRAAATAEALAGGRLDGVIVFWEIELDDRARLSTDPAEAGADCSWGTAAWSMAPRGRVERGERLEIRFEYRAPRAIAEVRRA
jgi:SAM-dependent methyltransferase